MPLSMANRRRVDVSSQESLANGFAEFQKDFGNALDICVPCAGINRHMKFLEFTFEDHNDLLSVNVLGLFFTAQLAAKQMVANGTEHGSIVLVASMASHIAVPTQLCSAYCDTKGAVRSITPAIAKEMAEYVSSSQCRSIGLRSSNTESEHQGQFNLPGLRTHGNDGSCKFSMYS